MLFRFLRIVAVVKVVSVLPAQLLIKWVAGEYLAGTSQCSFKRWVVQTSRVYSWGRNPISESLTLGVGGWERGIHAPRFHARAFLAPFSCFHYQLDTNSIIN